MKTHEIRQAFINFYSAKGHEFVPGSSTIPVGDPTILFTIAGMTQFKDVLSGAVARKHPRVTNSQKCIRAADLEDVGLDGRHLTMFEMLGVWSFGDYFKRESILWSYEFIRDVVKLDLTKIWVSVHESDDSAAEIWREIGIPPDRIVKLGDSDNFWAMGPTGPCGPCTEIYYDQGPSVGCEAGQGPTPGAICKGPGCDCDRYLEFWNNVFMEFNRDETGTLHPLPSKSVDTGVGLERLSAICQGVTSAYETDAFDTLARAVCFKAGLGSEASPQNLSLADRQSIQVMSDHMRTLVVALSDGATFSNEGRGYVLRRILRRAVRFGNRLQENHHLPGDEPFLYRICEDVARSLGGFYPEILAEVPRVSSLVRDEEERFLRTLSKGMELFRIQADQTVANGLQLFPGEVIFQLHDSFGFPADLTALLCRERSLNPDLAQFEVLMNEQKLRSRQGSRFYEGDGEAFVEISGQEPKETSSEFIGYLLPAPSSLHPLPHIKGPWNETPLEQTRESAQYGTLGLARFSPIHFGSENALRYRLGAENAEFEVVFASTPFYPEGGGQISDAGFLVYDSGISFQVQSVRKSIHGIVHHLRLMSGEERLSLDRLDRIFCSGHTFLVDIEARRESARHHSATHLLHAALRNVLGDHIRQAGSQVGPKGLRFDFTHPRSLTNDECREIEKWVNSAIDAALPVSVHQDIPIDDAKKMGALAMFDEKYGDRVRVLEMGSVSMELCGGTHVSNTAAIGAFRIVKETSVTAGVRRIEALAGAALREQTAIERKELEKTATLLKCPLLDVSARVEGLKASEKELQRKVEEAQRIALSSASSDLSSRAQEILPGLVFLSHFVGPIDSPKDLESMGDSLRESTKGMIVLGGLAEGKAHILALTHPSVLKSYPKASAGNLVKLLAEGVNGRGGGKAEFAKGGGANTEALPEVLLNARETLLSLMK